MKANYPPKIELSQKEFGIKSFAKNESSDKNYKVDQAEKEK